MTAFQPPAALLAAATLAAVAPGVHAEAAALAISPASPSMALLRAVNPGKSSIPGISQAVVVEGGRLAILSGQVPMAPDGQIPQGLEAQLEQAFHNLEAALHAAGATRSGLARITIYVRDLQPEQLPVIRRVRDRFIDQGQPPASALIGVAALFHPEVLVEVDAVAVLAAGA